MTNQAIQEVIRDYLQIEQLNIRIPDMVRFGQRMLEKRLKIRAMEYYPSNGSLAAGVSSLAIPNDYLELIYFALLDGTSRYPIYDRKSNLGFIDAIVSHKGDTTNTGRPLVITQMGSDFIFDRYTDKVYPYEWAYYRNLPALSAESDTNWWTTNAEEALIYSSLVFAIPLLPPVIGKAGAFMDPRAQVWKSLFEEQIDILRNDDARERLSGVKRRVVYHD